MQGLLYKRWEGRKGNRDLSLLCWCLPGHCYASLGQHQALAVLCTGWTIRGTKDFCIPQYQTTQGISENPALLGQLKNKKCHSLYSSLWGGKALVLLPVSSPPVLLHTMNNQRHAMRFRCQSLMLCSHISSGSAASYSCCPTWVVTPADQVGSSQPLMVAQGHPANSFCSDLCCQHRVALSHLALQVQWGRKEPPTAQKGPTVQQGEGPTLYGTLTNLPDPCLCPTTAGGHRAKSTNFVSP